MNFKIRKHLQVSDVGSAYYRKPIYKIERVKYYYKNGTTTDGSRFYYRYNKIYNNKIDCENLLCDCIKHVGDKRGEFHDMVKYNRKKGKGVSIIVRDNNQEYEVAKADKLEKLQPRQLMFFTLYNAPEYKDLTLNITTYLDEVACWLVSYGFYESAYKRYGKILKRKVKYDKESKEYYQDIYSDDTCIGTISGKDEKDFYAYLDNNYVCRKGNFVFNSQMDFVQVKNLAKSVVNSVRFKDAQQELVSTNLGDTQTRIKDYYLKLDEIYKNTNDPKVRLECLKLGGKWLGMEQINISTEQNHIIQGIQVAVANGDLKDFELDEDLFEKVE